MKRRHQLAALILILAHAPTAGLGKPFVLCIGADGHVAVEADGAFCGACKREDVEEEPCCPGEQDPCLGDAEKACCSCLDFSISVVRHAPAGRVESWLPLDPAAAGAPVAARPLEFFEPELRSRSGLPPPARSSPLRFLRSTRLLC